MAFYLRENSRFVPSPHCIGPWDPRLQHGGPPSALLGRAIERHGDAAAFVTTRVTIELLRPIPLVPLEVTLIPVREGRQVQWLQTELVAEGKLVARASGVRVARAPLGRVPAPTVGAAAPRGPADLPDFTFDFFPSDEGYHRAVEMRIAEGEWSKGPLTAWLRPRIPLIDGESLSALERTLILVDATNGLAPSLPVERFTFINPDLTVHLSRPLEGEWLALSARAMPPEEGAGLVQSRLFDARGELGSALQSLVIRPR